MPQEPIYRFIKARVAEDLNRKADDESLVTAVTALGDIADYHLPVKDKSGIWVCKACSWHHEEIGEEISAYAPCDHLRVIAAVWRDQPGFYESWARREEDGS